MMDSPVGGQTQVNGNDREAPTSCHEIEDARRNDVNPREGTRPEFFLSLAD